MLINTVNGRRLTGRQEILEGWLGRYSSLLNAQTTADMDCINSLPEREKWVELDDPPTIKEVENAIAQLKNGKLPRLPPETYKEGGSSLHEIIYIYFHMLNVEYRNSTPRVQTAHNMYCL